MSETHTLTTRVNRIEDDAIGRRRIATQVESSTILTDKILSRGTSTLPPGLSVNMFNNAETVFINASGPIDVSVFLPGNVLEYSVAATTLFAFSLPGQVRSIEISNPATGEEAAVEWFAFAGIATTVTPGTNMSLQQQITDNKACIDDLKVDVAAVQSVVTQAAQDASDALAGVGNKVDRTGDTLTGALVSSASTTGADGDGTLTTKDYVDTLSRGYQADFVATDWAGTGPRTLSITQATHDQPVNTAYSISVLDSASQRLIDVDRQINTTNGLVIVTTAGPAFAGTIRIS